MKKTFFKTLACLALTLIFVICGIYLIRQSFSKEVDYSIEYNFYRRLKDTTNVDELRTKLQELGFEYTISNNIVELKQYSNIKFNILDDKTCNIAANKVMENFIYLDGDSIIDITITTEREGDKIVETLTKVDEGTSYIKKDYLYFVKEPPNDEVALVGIVSMAIGVGFTVYLLFDIMFMIRKAKQKKQEKVVVKSNESTATPPSKTVNNNVTTQRTTPQATSQVKKN